MNLTLSLTCHRDRLVVSGRAQEVAHKLRELALAHPDLLLRDFLHGATQEGRFRSWSVCDLSGKAGRSPGLW